MNKLFTGVVVGLALGAFSAASAVDLSVGGGGFFASDFGAGFYGLKLKYEPANIDRVNTTPWYGGGINLFFDATYAEIGLGLTFASGKPKSLRNGEKVDIPDDISISGTGLNIGVLGKYPIALSDELTLFPAVGIDYLLCLSATAKKDGEEEKLDGKDGKPKAGDFSALWIKFGVGLDYNLTEQLFLRPAVLYGIRLSNKFEKDQVDDYKDGAPSDATVESPLGHGISVRLGIGYKL